MDKTGKSIVFGYNDSGIRTSKTVDGVTTDYILEGSKVVRETQGTAKSIHYSYDSEGRLVSMNLTNSTYPTGAEFYYVFNGQGDVIGLLDSEGTKVVTYTYDSWGKPVATTGTLAATVGADNSYRYRGYGYDSETGLYYLQSRYYNSDWGRFINADEITGVQGDILSHNMFAYCKNNPVNNYDPDGHLVLNIIGAIVVAGFGAALGTMVANHYGLKGLKRYAVITGFAAGGAVIGWFAGPLVSKYANILIASMGVGKASTYKDITSQGSRFINKATNVTKAKFGKTLLKNGWIKSISKDMKTLIFKKNGAKYVLRDLSKSTGGPTADFYKAGSKSINIKIRLGVK